VFYLLILFVLVVAAFGVLKTGRRVRYRRGRFLSANEKIFLRALDAALGHGYRAFAQVRLAELADVEDAGSPQLRRKALIGVFGRSVDFVICNALSLEPVAAIEVDDRTHCLPERRARDAFVNAVFAEIDFPLLHVTARRSYSVAELREFFVKAGLPANPDPQGAFS
jgi:hypothetical protein